MIFWSWSRSNTLANTRRSGCHRWHESKTNSLFTHSSRMVGFQNQHRRLTEPNCQGCRDHTTIDTIGSTLECVVLRSAFSGSQMRTYTPFRRSFIWDERITNLKITEVHWYITRNQSCKSEWKFYSEFEKSKTFFKSSKIRASHISRKFYGNLYYKSQLIVVLVLNEKYLRFRLSSQF